MVLVGNLFSQNKSLSTCCARADILHPNVWGRFLKHGDAAAGACFVLEALLGKAKLGTFSTHFYAWRKFAAWCKAHGACALPVKSKLVERYFLHLRATSNASNKSVVDSASRAITFVHTKLNGLPSPCKSFLALTLQSAVATSRARPVKRAPTVEREAIFAIYDRYTQPLNPDWMFVFGTCVMLAFLFACRFSDLCQVNVQNVRVKKGSMSLGFEERKTETFYTEVEAGRAVDSPYAPDRVWERFVRRFAHLVCMWNGPLLREMRFTFVEGRGMCGTVLESGCMSLDMFTRLFRQALHATGMPAAEADTVTSHTVRRSATRALLDGGAPDSEVRRVGNWKCAESVDAYRTASSTLLQRTTARMLGVQESGARSSSSHRG